MRGPPFRLVLLKYGNSMTSAGVLHCAPLRIQPHDAVCSGFRAAVPALRAVMVKLTARIAPPATETLMRQLISACFAAVSALLLVQSPACGRPFARASPCMASRRCRPISTHFPYANPDAPKGGRIDYAWQGIVRQPEPVHRPGRRRARPVRRDLRQQCLRDADGALARRGLHALSADRPVDRHRCRPHLCRVHARPARQILRRHADHARTT